MRCRVSVGGVTVWGIKGYMAYLYSPLWFLCLGPFNFNFGSHKVTQTYIYIYIYLYIYLYTYIYMYIYIYTWILKHVAKAGVRSSELPSRGQKSKQHAR